MHSPLYTYDAVSDISCLNAENALWSITHIHGADIITHFAVLREAWERAIRQGSKIDDLEFFTIILGSMPREWLIYISILYEQKTSMDIIAQLTMHDVIIACNWKPAFQTTQALAMMHQRTTCSMLICSNPVCWRVRHTINKYLKPGREMEGQYPDWWKKKGNATSIPTPKSEGQMHSEHHTCTHRAGSCYLRRWFLYLYDITHLPPHCKISYIFTLDIIYIIFIYFIEWMDLSMYN